MLVLTVMIHCVHAAEGIPEWVEMLRSKDYLVYKKGVAQLQNAGGAAVPELLRALEVEPAAAHDWDLHNGALETLTRIGRPAVPPLVKAAKAKNLAALEALAQLGPEAVDAVPVLRQLVLKAPLDLGRAAAEALAAIGKPGVPALVAGLKQARGEPRETCANTLGWVGPAAQEAVPALVEVLLSDAELQRIAARSLRRIGISSKELEAQLLAKLGSQDPVVRKGAVLGLGAMRTPGKDTVGKVLDVARSDPDHGVRSEALNALPSMAPGDVEVARALVGAMSQEGEWNLIGQAATALAGMDGGIDGGKKVVPELTALLKDGAPEARALAADVLGWAGPDARPAIPLLRERLHDPDGMVCSKAADALGWLGRDAKEAAPEVAAALAEKRINVFVAAHTLQRLGSPEPSVVRILIDQLNAQVSNKERGREERLSSVPMSAVASLINALGSCGPAAQEAIPIITRLSDDGNWLVRQAVVSAFASISSNSTEAVDLAIRHLKDEHSSVRMCAANTLGQMRERATTAIPNLSEGLQDGDEMPRATCARALGQIGSPTAIPALLDALHDRSAEVRIEAAHSLLQLQPESAQAWDALAEELQNHWAGPRAGAASKLAELGPSASKAVAPLLKLLDDRHDRVRAAAAQALGKIGPAATVAIPELKKACLDPEPNVRREATLALQRLEGQGAHKEPSP